MKPSATTSPEEQRLQPHTPNASTPGGISANDGTSNGNAPHPSTSGENTSGGSTSGKSTSGESTLTQAFPQEDEWNTIQMYDEDLRIQNEILVEERQAVAAEQQPYHHLFEYAPDGYLVTNAYGIIQKANQAAAHLLNIAPQFLIGKPLLLYVAPEERQAWRRHLLSLAYMERIELETRLQPRHGPLVAAILTLTAERDQSGEVTEVRWLVRDITRRKRFEDELRRAYGILEERVRERTAELEEVVDTLQAEILEREQTEEALRASEEQFRAAFEQAAVGIVQITLDGRLLRGNPGFCKILGCDADEITRLAVKGITHPDDYEKNQEHLGSLLAGEIPNFSLEKRYLRKDGSSVWVHLMCSLVRDGLGKPAYLLAIVQDINLRKSTEEALRQAHDELERRVQERTAELAQTNIALKTEMNERRTVEEALREVNQMLEALIAASPLAIITLDPRSRVQMWNPAAERMLGWTEQEVLGRPTPSVPEELTEQNREVLLSSLQGRQLSAYETRRRRKDGSLIDVSLWTAPLYDARGRPCASLGILSDITERKRAEQEREMLLQSVQRRAAELDAVIESIPDALYIGNQAGIWRCNRAALEMIGFDSVEELNQNLEVVAERLAARKAGTDVLIPFHRQAFIRALRGETCQAEGVVTHFKTEKDVMVRSIAAPIRLDGEIIGAVCINTDITERKKAETMRHELLRRVVNAQEEERRRISLELHDQMGQHLTALMMGLKSLPDVPDTGLTPPSVNQRIERLQELTQGLMQQVHRLAWELRPAALDDLGLETALGRYVEDWSEHMQLTADFHSRGFRSSTAKGSAAISRRLPMHIETTLYRIVQEALTNVQRHAQANHVSVLLELGQHHVSAIVEDDGRGFDDSSAQTTNRLGLLGMHERASLVGGTLAIETEPGQGTTVYVRIPI